MDTRPIPGVSDEALPDLLTVEEAADILRVGRTKAYRMAAQWRSSDGTAGLPVLDFGNVLRVPTHALEQLVGARLRASSRARQPEPAPDEAVPVRSTRPPRSRTQPSAQLDLFDPQSEA